FSVVCVWSATLLLTLSLHDALPLWPIVEILEEHEEYPSALPARREVAHSAWVTIQIGCDNSCAFCIVPAVRGPEVSRRLGDIVRSEERRVGKEGSSRWSTGQ